MSFFYAVVSRDEDEPDEELVVAQLFAELSCICADGSWEWPADWP